jgi:hypothetical protein
VRLEDSQPEVVPAHAVEAGAGHQAAQTTDTGDDDGASDRHRLEGRPALREHEVVVAEEGLRGDERAPHSATDDVDPLHAQLATRPDDHRRVTAGLGLVAEHEGRARSGR